jgi:iron complex outermembrane receptor protein
MSEARGFTGRFARSTKARVAAMLVASLWAWSAQAQEQPAQAAPPLQTVVITGSYIPRIDKETPSPVTTISAEDIEHSGLTTVADVVRTISADNSGTLPTAFAGAFAAGASGLALRGLTVNSTLVLIDGLRAANYALPDDGIRSFVDLNSIQVGTIERIEVLRDGASSVYGADAIGGVVNVILKKQFQGFTANAQVGDSQHRGGYGSGFERHLDFTAGTGDLAADHYNAYVSAEWETNDRIGAGQRGYPFNTSDYTPFGGGNKNAQPGNGFGSIYGAVTPAQLGPLGTLLDGVALPGAVSQPLQPCPASAPEVHSGGNGFCNQDENGYSDAQPPTQRFGITGRFTVQLSDTTQAYLSGSYYNNQSIFPSFPPYAVPQITTGVPNNTENIVLPVTIPVAGVSCVNVTVATPACKLNPNDPFAAQGNYALINYAFGPLGAQYNTVNDHNLRLVGDVSGVWRGWNWDASAVVNHTWLDYSLLNFINFNQLMTDVTDGTYNFVNPSANSSATLSAIAPKVTNYDSSDMDTIVLRVNRPLATLPGGPLAVALGAEYRYEAQVDLNFNAVPVVQQLGFSQAIGSRNIQSVSAELDAPVLESLELNASGRWDHYSDFGNAETPKFGFKWKPIPSLALRGTYSQGFRAPSFAENGSAESEGFVPSYGFAVGTPINAQHHNDIYITDFNLGELNTANPNIQPEKSKSYTAGLVWQPLSNFSAAADYYYIKKTNLITPANLAAALAQYATNGTVPAGFTFIADNPDPLYPTAIPRLVTIGSGYVNAPAEYTDGVDFDFNAHIDLGNWGRLTEELSATRILSFVYEQTGSPNLQYVGTQSPYNLSSGAGTPQDRASLSSTWQKGPFTLTADVYYVGAYHEYGLDVLPPGVCLTTGLGFAANAANCRVGSFTYGNITGSYQLNGQWQIYGTIENVADKLPPVDTPSYNAVNYNATYSQTGIIGRFFRLGFKFTL